MFDCQIQIKYRGGSRIKIGPSGGRREHFWGISCEKITILRQQIIFFPILGAGCPPWIRPWYKCPSLSRKPSYKCPSLNRKPSYKCPSLSRKPSHKCPSLNRKPSYKCPSLTCSRKPSYKGPSLNRNPSYKCPSLSRKPSYKCPSLNRKPSYKCPSPNPKPSYLSTISKSTIFQFLKKNHVKGINQVLSIIYVNTTPVSNGADDH